MCFPLATPGGFSTSTIATALLSRTRGSTGTRMLSCSLRRASMTPMMSLSSISRSPGQVVTASSNGLFRAARPLHQRRYSSSKPPVPPSDGSNGIDASSQAPAKGVSASGEKREGKATRRRGRDHSRHNGSSKSNRHAAFSNPPSVPSTQHLQPHGKCHNFLAGPLFVRSG